MNEDTTLIANDSAVKALAALDDISGEGLANALANVLSRKLGQTAPPLPSDDHVCSKFERFFDILFEVAPPMTPLPLERVIELAERAHSGLMECITDVLADEDEEDPEGMAAMYREDAAEYEKMIALLRAGDIKGAFKVHDRMDTAARGRFFADQGAESHHLAIFYRDLAILY